MGWPLYLSLSGMMFLQFAVWGAWSPVLCGPASGSAQDERQTDRMDLRYGLPGLHHLADDRRPDRRSLDRYRVVPGGSHLIGGVLLLVAARKTTFLSLFVAMGLYSLLFAPTLALGQLAGIPSLAQPGRRVFLGPTVGLCLVGAGRLGSGGLAASASYKFGAATP